MMLIKRKFVVTHFFILLLKCVLSVDYCEIERQKCSHDAPHIGCKKTAITFEVNPNCTNIKFVKLNNNVKNYILQLHNEMRDKLAAGNVPNYPPASRMLEMFYDSELEATACLHAQYCTIKHDKCRATPSYPSPGQNLYMSMQSSHPRLNITKEWKVAINLYFDEYADVHPNIIEKYVSREPHQKMYGHFTVMSKDNNDRIGCCHITFEDDSSNPGEVMYGHLLICNYRETNFIDGRTYLKGTSRSRCKDYGSQYETSEMYKHLCTNPKEREKLTLSPEKVIVEQPKDFCELAKLKCGRHKHVACEKDSGLVVNPNCRNIKEHRMTDNYKNVLLKQHNTYRNFVASGNHMSFPSASKMIEMSWDPSLEKVACAHVKYCHLEHSKCLATENHEFPAQSLFGISNIPANYNHTGILLKTVEVWFNQSISRKMTFDNFESNHFSNFAHMVKEDQNSVGCCFITYDKFDDNRIWNHHLITCLYGSHVKKNSKLYTEGRPGSQCKDHGDEYSTSSEYRNLCTKKNSAKRNHFRWSTIGISFGSFIFVYTKLTDL